MTITVAAVQMAMVDDVAANVATAERLVRKAAAEGLTPTRATVVVGRAAPGARR